MTKETKKLIIIGSIILLTSVGIYVGFKVRNARRERQKMLYEQDFVPETPSISPSTSPGASSAPAGINVRDFQQFARDLGFLNVAGKNKGKLIDVDGVWGTNSEAAWVQLGTKYKTKMNPNVSPTVTTTSPTVTTTTPIATSTKPSYNKDAFVRLAGRLYRSMDGAGTRSDFWVVIGYLKNQADYDALKSAFGTKEGATMYQWIEGDIRKSIERMDYNQIMKSKNIKSSLTIR